MAAKKITKKDAKALWEKFGHGIKSADAALKEIVEARAWEPLGMSFSECYDTYVGTDVRLTSRESVVLLAITYGEEFGWDGEQIAKVSNHKVTKAQAEAVKKFYDAGVPPEYANPGPKYPTPGPGEHVVKTHTRHSPAPAQYVRVPLEPGEAKKFRELAAKHGLSFEDVAAGGVRYAFKALQSGGATKKSA